MKKWIILLLLPLFATAQHAITADLDNFWQAYDSIRLTSDTARQTGYIQSLYINKASEGLQAFMRNKDGLDKKWISLIKSDPLFWDSIRQKCVLLKNNLPALEGYISYYNTIYPQLKPSNIYFIIGVRQQGGTIRGNMSLIGTEVVLANAAALPAGWLQMCVHEYTHTQQKRPDFQKIDVLTSSIREGACDFMAELILKTPFKAVYMDYGNKHEKEVAGMFNKDMFTRNNDKWVSTGNESGMPAPDLGYFIGYKICKAYYNKAADKQEAIKEIIELDYADALAVQAFAKAAGWP